MLAAPYQPAFKNVTPHHHTVLRNIVHANQVLFSQLRIAALCSMIQTFQESRELVKNVGDHQP